MHLRHCLEPDGVLNDANEAYDRRFVHLSQTLDGIFRLDGQLDAEGGAALRSALEALMGPPADDDDRTATQRRADALVELARQQLDGGALPEVAGQKTPGGHRTARRHSTTWCCCASGITAGCMKMAGSWSGVRSGI
jgi:Domain of unknown function (DUF222)